MPSLPRLVFNNNKHFCFCLLCPFLLLLSSLSLLDCPVAALNYEAESIGATNISKNQTTHHLYRNLTMSMAPNDVCLERSHLNAWRRWAVEQLWAERRRMGKTPLILLDKITSVKLYFKNESASATESLKHRYSWALAMWALLEGHVHPNTVVYEYSTGNTARSEAYMFTLIGVRFVAVLPATTEQVKILKIQRAGGEVLRVSNTRDFLTEARRRTKADPNGFFINQFGNSERALDFHESGNFDKESVNLFHEVLSQFKAMELKSGMKTNVATVPTHFVCSAATGGTISSVGRYAKKYGLLTEIVLADTQFSAYFDVVVSGRFQTPKDDPRSLWVPPGMAGTGFGYAGPIVFDRTSSFVPSLIDQALKIPDLASVAAMHVLRQRYAINGGPSTGVCFAATLMLIGKTLQERKDINGTLESPMNIVMLLADNGANYDSSYYNETWIDKKFAPHGGLSIFRCWKEVLETFIMRMEVTGKEGREANGPSDFGTDPITLGAVKCFPPSTARKTNGKQSVLKLHH